MFKRNPYQDSQSGVAIIGIVLMAVLVIGGIGFIGWTLSQKEEPVILYTPPAVSADDPLSEGRSSKELVQDVKILEAIVKRADGYRDAAAKALNDVSLPIESTETGSAVEQDRLSELQTDFIAECDRRIKILTETQALLDKLTDSQRPGIEGLINKEITALNGMKVRVANAADLNAFASDRQALNEEYNAYLLALTQTNLLVFANDQTVLGDKINRVGGKFQERINEASSNGVSTAMAQTSLNSYQANKVTARDLTDAVVKVVPTIQPGEQSSNRAVLRTYYDQLNTAHNELTKAVGSAKTLAVEVQKFDRAQ